MLIYRISQQSWLLTIVLPVDLAIRNLYILYMYIHKARDTLFSIIYTCSAHFVLEVLLLFLQIHFEPQNWAPQNFHGMPSLVPRPWVLGPWYENETTSIHFSLLDLQRLTEMTLYCHAYLSWGGSSLVCALGLVKDIVKASRVVRYALFYITNLPAFAMSLTSPSVISMQRFLILPEANLLSSA